MCLCCCLVAQSCPTLCHPMDYKCTSNLWPWEFSRKEYGCGFLCSPAGDLLDPKIEFLSAMAPVLQADSLLLSQNISCIHETHFNYEDS